MADSDKNILITPNRGSTTDLPKIEFTGADPNTITLSVLDDATLSFSGTSGQLFSISDNLDGTIFSVNDVSGIPSIEVDDDGTVRVAEFAGNLLVGTNVDTNSHKMQLVGTTYQHPLYIESAFSDKIKLKSTNTSVSGNGIDFFNSDDKLTGSLRTSWSSSNKYTELYQSFNTVASEVRSLRLKPGDHLKAVYANTEYNIFNDNYHPNADKWTTARTLSLTGDVTGSVSWDGSANASITTVIADDSHNHTIANVDGLQTALNGKVDDSQVLTNVPSGAVFTDTVYTHPTHPGDDLSVDTGALTGATVISDLDFNVTTDTLGHVTDANATVATRTLTAANIGAAPASHNHSLTLSGDVTGSGSVSGTISVSVNDNSHNHSNYLSYGSNGNVNVNSLLGTVLFAGSTGGWSNRGPSGHNGGALLSINTHPGSYYSQLWFDTANSNFYHRASNAATPTASWDKVWTSRNDGSGTGLDADLLDGQHGSYYYSAGNPPPLTADPTLTLTGDVTGSATFTNLGNATLTATVANDSHSHSNYLPISGKAADSNLLDGRDSTNYGATLATYGTTAGSSGRIRITAPFNTNSEHMFQVTVSVYSSYTCHEYVVSGYMYGSTNQWYVPKVVYSGTGTPDIVVGRDSSGKAYISIANGSYTGVRVHNMTRGYYTSVTDTYDPWTITITGGTENSVTPSVYKTWNSGNDGSGSGLDADTVDGYHAGDIVLDMGTARIADMNSLGSQSAKYSWNNVTTGRPAASQSNEYGVLLHLDYDGGSAYQQAWDISQSNLYVRTLNYSTDSGSWHKVYHSGNDGSGSGLDADLLDGIDSSQFLRSDVVDVLCTSKSSGSLLSRNGFTDFIGYNPNYGSYIGGGVSNASNYLYSGGYISKNGIHSLWHSGNDGSGSGLDADLLDGVQSGSFLRSDADDTASGQYNFTKVNDHAIKVGTIRGTAVGSQSGQFIQLYERVNIGGPSGWGDSSTTAAPQYGLSTYGGAHLATHSGEVKIGRTITQSHGGLQILRNGGTPTTSGYSVANGASIEIYSNNQPVLGFHNSGNSACSLYESSGDLYLTRWNGTATGSRLWHSNNDGTGSGLDADLLDGQQASDFANAEYINNNYYDFTVNGDANTYYPVGISEGGHYGFQTYSISRGYSWTAPSTWNTSSHKGGLTFTFQNSGDGAWGGNDKTIRIVQFAESYTTMVGGIGLSTGGAASAGVIVWLRGGGAKYRFHSPKGSKASVSVYLSSVTASNGTVFAPRSYNSTTVQNEVYAKYPVRGNSGLYSGNNVVWHAGNDGSGSGLDADLLDGYEWMTSGKNVRANEFYADNWFRNYNSGEGLYNEANAMHWYSEGNTSYSIYSGQSTTNIRFKTSGNNTRGYVYANNSNQIGFLNSSGGWSLKVDNSGNTVATGNVTAYSDERLKSDIKPIQNALKTVTSLNGVTYIRKDTGKKELGFIAQNVKKIVPELVDVIDTTTSEEEGYNDLHVMKYQNTVALLVEAIKEQQTQIEELKAQISILKGE